MTPMMKQYIEIKENYPDAILFFRAGDFYEMFLDDAIVASRELELVLTSRSKGEEAKKNPMCGVPYHAADTYIDRLVAKGYKVAICEQLEDPATAKGIVKRDVVRVVTPGTIVDSKMLDEKKNNFLCTVYGEKSTYGVAFSDLSTGEVFVTSVGSKKRLVDEIARYMPTEIIVND
ncbi:MAG: DNA mismatch repair protein MutS, partial [Clostridia bacterium]|nr:DNA mismatch repair protein MutS [Clostridia bacterium]